MGVKRYLVLHHSGGATVGPAILPELRNLFKKHYSYFDHPESYYLPATGSWRKRATTLFKFMHRILGPAAGALKELKTHNPRADSEYRMVLAHLATRPKTPPIVNRG